MTQVAGDSAKWFDKVFRDRSGRIVLAQRPNVPIIGWAVFAVAAMVVGGRRHDVFGQLSTAFLFTWAYLEIAQGVNYFRRALGLAVLVVVVIGFFQ